MYYDPIGYNALVKKHILEQEAENKKRQEEIKKYLPKKKKK